MFNIGPLELVAIFVVALLVFGPEKLPEIGRQVGRAIREFRQIQSSLQSQLSDVMDAPPDPVVPPPAPVAVGDADAVPASQEAVSPPVTGEPPHNTTSDLPPQRSRRLGGGFHLTGEP